MKKILKFLGSMGFAISLLTVLAAACVVASFVTQGQSYECTRSSTLRAPRS